MSDNGRISALIWAVVWFIGAGLIYFVVIPIGIDVPSYVTQSPALFPQAVTIMLGVLAAIQFIIEWRGIANKKVEKISAWFFVTPAVAGAFAWLLAPIGFPLTASCALAALFYIFGERQPGIIIGVTGVVVIGIHVIFVYLLNIPLPVGILG